MREKERSLRHVSRITYHVFGVNENFLMPYLRDGEAILLLDGLDEVPTEEKRGVLSQWIHREVHLAFPKCPVMVTSRFSGYRGDAVLSGHYLRMENQDYQLPQIQQFLKNWLTAVETRVNADTPYWRDQASEKAQDLYRRIERTKVLCAPPRDNSGKEALNRAITAPFPRPAGNPQHGHPAAQRQNRTREKAQLTGMFQKIVDTLRT